MDTPAADIAVDPTLVARLIRAQHPDLAGRRLTLVANGWDNVIYRLGDDLCVRLPRRRVATAPLLAEQRWLPALADRVAVPIPVPVRVGVPTDDYPWPWTIVRWYEGELAADMPPADRGEIVADLARFVVALHVPAPDDAPHNPVRGVPLASRASAVHERLSSGVIPRSDELRAIWDRLAAVPPWAGPPLWVHGDLHPANILVESEPVAGRSRLAAVLDFGDLTGGDPATDLAVAWLLFDAPARAAFRAHVEQLAEVDRHTWARARAWALNLGTALAAHSGDNPRMNTIGAYAIDQVLAEP